MKIDMNRVVLRFGKHFEYQWIKGDRVRVIPEYPSRMSKFINKLLGWELRITDPNRIKDEDIIESCTLRLYSLKDTEQ